MSQGDYIPSAPIDDEARKRNGNLPGQGGIYNYVNMHVYHYAGNNPVKYVDPDGRNINGWHIAGAFTVLGGAAVAVTGTALSGGSAILPSLKVGGEIIILGFTMMATGQAVDKIQQGQNLKNKAQTATPAPSQPPNDDDDKSNMRHLNVNEIEKRTGTTVHDVKDTIRNQYSYDIKNNNIGENFDIYENNDQVIIKGNQTGRELNLNINLESLGVN